MNKGNRIDNNLILILKVQVSINLSKAVFVLVFIPGTFKVFM